MDFKYKVRNTHWEDGEFSAENTIDLIAATDLFRNFKWQGLNITTNQDIVFINSNKDFFTIERYSNDAFEVRYFPTDVSYYYQRIFDRSIVPTTIKLFFNSDIDGLVSTLLKKKEENNVLRKALLEKDFEYKITFKREVNFMLFTLLYSLILFPSQIFVLLFPMLWIYKLILSLIFSFIYLPGYFLHWNYKKYNRGLSLRISRGNASFDIAIDDNKFEYDKNNIDHIIQYYTPYNSRNPWCGYGFTRIFFKDGDSLALSTLLIDDIDIASKFPRNKFISKNKFICFIRGYAKT